MVSVAIRGTNPTALAARLACRAAGFDTVDLFPGAGAPEASAVTLPANLTRIVVALGRGKALEESATTPDREQVRFGKSGYLLSELPLGQFARDRYGAPCVNLTGHELHAVLGGDEHVGPPQPMDELSSRYNIVLDCGAGDCPTRATHTLWYAETTTYPPLASANVTWLLPGQTAWLLNTPAATHVYFATLRDARPDPAQWHACLAEAAAMAVPEMTFNPTHTGIRDQWFTGNVVRLGPACRQDNPFRRECLHTGLEDAWVLGRMLDNYEEDIQTGLREYEKYRLPRTTKIARDAANTALSYTSNETITNLRRNLGIAFATRFLPEIAMQRVDWLYAYDCIRGFR